MRTYTKLILVLIVVAIALGALLYTYHVGQRTDTTASASSLAVVFGALSFPANSSAGSLNVTVRNTAGSAIDKISVTDASQLQGLDSLVFLYQGGAVSPLNPLPAGATVGGLVNVSSTAEPINQNYEMSVVLQFVGGGVQTQTLYLAPIVR